MNKEGQRGNEEWGTEMSDSDSSSERQVAGSKAGGSPVSTSWVT